MDRSRLRYAALFSYSLPVTYTKRLVLSGLTKVWWFPYVTVRWARAIVPLTCRIPFKMSPGSLSATMANCFYDIESCTSRSPIDGLPKPQLNYTDVLI